MYHSSNIKYFLSIAFMLFISANLFAQQQNLFLTNEQLYRYENLGNKNKYFHSNCKPYNQQQISSLVGCDSLQGTMVRKTKSVAMHHVLNDHLLWYNYNNFAVSLDPVLTFVGGCDLSFKSKALETAIGISLVSDIGTKLSVHYSAFCINAKYPFYIDSVIQKTEVIPQQGYADSSMLLPGYKSIVQMGYAAFAPNKVFRFELGNGKQFLGDGYRSLLLSDNSYNYPYFKIITTIWKFQYINLYTELRDIRGSLGNTQLMKKKYAAAHYLSWNVSKRFNFSFFESIVWQSRSAIGGLGYDVNYLSPVVFYRPVEYSVGSPDNDLLGVSFKLKIAKNIQLYSQVLIDEFYLKFLKESKGWWANKQGYQFGFKMFNALHLKNLYIQGEANYVRPYTYSHGNPIQNYGHYNQSLAHPLGANFYEAIGIINYQHKRIFFNAKVMYAKVGLDTAAVNYGQNIYASYTTRPSDFGNFVGQGLKTKVLLSEFKFSYLINPKCNLLFEAGLLYRSLQNVVSSANTSTIFFGIRTSLYNLYQDF